MTGQDTILRNLDSYIKNQKTKLSGNMRYAMTATENQSKHAAPWTDRTGNARNSIFGTVNDKGNVITGYHGIGMFYGKYLELSNQGKYRVIWPSMDWLRGRLLKWLVQ